MYELTLRDTEMTIGAIIAVDEEVESWLDQMKITNVLKAHVRILDNGEPTYPAWWIYNEQDAMALALMFSEVLACWEIEGAE